MENKKRLRPDVPARRVGSLHIQSRVGGMHRRFCDPAPDENSHNLGAFAYGYKRELEKFAAA